MCYSNRMLHEFLEKERNHILALCSEKLCSLSDNKSSSEEMDVGLPLFYNELLEVLRVDEAEDRGGANNIPEDLHRESAQRRGKESLRLGYTISQVVHGYGALCQAITEYAQAHHLSIEPREFNRLNFCLDVAIAEAVTEFNKGQRDSANQEEVLRLGFLAHELRNALGSVAMAHQMVKKGFVGVAGSTNLVLESSIARMRGIIDRSLAEVRLRGHQNLDNERLRVVDLISSVEVTSLFEARDKSIQIHVEVSPVLFILADRHLMISAISNLVHNAIKFTKPGGHVWIRGTALADRILIEVEDECGGLPAGKIEELFQPYTQKDINKTGAGLGLAISRGAITLCGGQISARDIPGRGCIFTIDLPQLSAIPGDAEGNEMPIH